METSESIITRRVVGLKDRHVLGQVRSLRIDCDALAVSALVIGDEGAKERVLPFNGIISIGDTFITVESSDDLLDGGSEAETSALNGFQLLKVGAFTKTGNQLASVKTYEFDPVFGTVTTLTLEDDTAFLHEDFIFFAEDFIFVDDHTKTAVELRAEAADQEAAAAAEEAPMSDEDRELIEFLVGQTLTDDVKSDDGEFSASAGAELTRELVEDAYAHGALLTLTMSV